MPEYDKPIYLSRREVEEVLAGLSKTSELRQRFIKLLAEMADYGARLKEMTARANADAQWVEPPHKEPKKLEVMIDTPTIAQARKIVSKARAKKARKRNSNGRP
jgi:hypothetical protein